MRLADETTGHAVDRILPTCASLNELARRLSPDNPGPIAGAISDVILRKTITLERENVLRGALGVELLPLVDERPVCSIHNVVHDTECDGEQGMAVWVHPKEKLVKAPGFGRTRKWRFMVELTDESTVAALRNFKEYIGGDWNETVRAALYLAMGGKSDDLYR